MLKLWKAVLFLLAAVIIQACTSGAGKADVDSEKEDLLLRVVRNQVFIEGGSFIMGDFGEVQNGRWLPYSPPTAEVDKAHTVELSGFSLSAYETTWQDFDTYNLI